MAAVAVSVEERTVAEMSVPEAFVCVLRFLPCQNIHCRNVRIFTTSDVALNELKTQQIAVRRHRLGNDVARYDSWLIRPSFCAKWIVFEAMVW